VGQHQKLPRNLTISWKQMWQICQVSAPQNKNPDRCWSEPFVPRLCCAWGKPEGPSGYDFSRTSDLARVFHSFFVGRSKVFFVWHQRYISPRKLTWLAGNPPWMKDGDGGRCQAEWRLRQLALPIYGFSLAFSVVAQIMGSFSDSTFFVRPPMFGSFELHLWVFFPTEKSPKFAPEGQQFCSVGAPAENQWIGGFDWWF